MTHVMVLAMLTSLSNIMLCCDCWVYGELLQLLHAALYGGMSYCGPTAVCTLTQMVHGCSRVVLEQLETEPVGGDLQSQQ